MKFAYTPHSCISLPPASLNHAFRLAATAGRADTGIARRTAFIFVSPINSFSMPFCHTATENSQIAATSAVENQ